MHDLKCGRMDRIPPKIAQEICMFFKDQDGNPGAGQQEPQHHAGRAVAGNAAAYRNVARGQAIFSSRVSASPPTRSNRAQVMRSDEAGISNYMGSTGGK